MTSCAKTASPSTPWRLVEVVGGRADSLGFDIVWGRQADWSVGGIEVDVVVLGCLAHAGDHATCRPQPAAESHLKRVPRVGRVLGVRGEEPLEDWRRSARTSCGGLGRPRVDGAARVSSLGSWRPMRGSGGGE